LRLAKKALADGKKVTLLNRNNFIAHKFAYNQTNGSENSLDAYLDFIRSKLPLNARDRLSASTVHSYKGAEADVVILLDANADQYPLIHPTWVFSRILGDTLDSIVEESRRLFYVALTRAIQSLFIVVDGDRCSEFVEQIRSCPSVGLVEWNEYPACHAGTDCWIVLIKNFATSPSGSNQDFREAVRANGYHWADQGVMAWAKEMPKSSDLLWQLKSESWARLADGLELHVCSTDGDTRARYQISNGCWVQVFDWIS
jgi:DNA helicase-4